MRPNDTSAQPSAVTRPDVSRSVIAAIVRRLWGLDARIAEIEELDPQAIADRLADAEARIAELEERP